MELAWIPFFFLHLILKSRDYGFPLPEVKGNLGGRFDDGGDGGRGDYRLKQNGQSSAIIKGSFSWELITDIDNRGGGAAIEKTIQFKVSKNVDYPKFREQVKNEIRSDSDNFEILDVFPMEVSEHSEQAVDQIVQSLMEKKSENVEHTKSMDIRVRRGTRMELYRLVLKGPGFTLYSDYTSQTLHPIDDVELICYISHFDDY